MNRNRWIAFGMGLAITLVGFAVQVQADTQVGCNVWRGTNTVAACDKFGGRGLTAPQSPDYKTTLITANTNGSCSSGKVWFCQGTSYADGRYAYGQANPGQSTYFSANNGKKVTHHKVDCFCEYQVD